MQTLNQHITLLRSYSENHLQINSFGVGDAWELVESFTKTNGVVGEDGTVDTNRTYPVMWVEVNGSNVTDHILTDNYNIYFADLVEKDERNETDVLSDMKLLCLDVISYLYKSTNVAGQMDVVLSFSMTDFTEKFGDEVSGWIVSVTLKQPFKYNLCAVPITDAPSGSISCSPATITDGGDTVEVASGGFYTCSGGSYTITINGVTYQTISANLAIPVVNSAGSTVGTVNAGTNVTIADDTVENSDASYTTNVVQGVTKVLPDITFTDTDGSTSSVPSVKNVSATLINTLTCAQLNNATTGLTISQRQNIQTINTLVSGQTTSFRSKDDGDATYRYGRLVNFTTLDCQNPFGTTARFTDTLGTQIYANNIVVDWGTGLMWWNQVLGGAGETWNTQIDGQPYTLGAYSDWRLANINEGESVFEYESTGLYTNSLGLAIGSFVGGTGVFFLSTTAPTSTTFAKVMSQNGSGNVLKTAVQSRVVCRNFTMAELGL